MYVPHACFFPSCNAVGREANLTIFVYVASDCDSPSRPQAELQQLLEFSVAEPSQDGLQASETVADSENIGAIVSGNRLIEVLVITPPKEMWLT